MSLGGDEYRVSMIILSDIPFDSPIVTAATQQNQSSLDAGLKKDQGGRSDDIGLQLLFEYTPEPYRMHRTISEDSLVTVNHNRADVDHAPEDVHNRFTVWS